MRQTGETFAKLNETFSVKIKIDKGKILGDGFAEQFDPKELVASCDKGLKT
jgi:hypothetical protein